jgi:hypothetical protein
MEYVITVGLTFILFCFIIVVREKINKKTYSKTVYRQSDMHNMLKVFFNKPISDVSNLTSQLKKRKEEKVTKVIILDDNAYWVVDNVFYVGVAVNGEVRPETAVPLDTSELSKTDINKLLFILDTLKGGKTNDSGSTGNQ